MIQFIAIGIGVLVALVLIKKIMKRPTADKFSKFCKKCGKPLEKNICIRCGNSKAIEFGI